MGNGYRVGVVDNLDKLFAVLPDHIRILLEERENADDLIEVVMDLGLSLIHILLLLPVLPEKFSRGHKNDRIKDPAECLPSFFHLLLKTFRLYYTT